MPNFQPAFVNNVVKTAYNGQDDDLLTAGLGWDGLMGGPPEFSKPLAPTAAELRKLAIYTNYRSLVDMSQDGGYGRLYGPNVSLAKHADQTPGAGKIAGIEYTACIRDSSGRVAATLLVQIPANFNTAAPFIVTGSSPGSRGIYGAIATAGEWGLKHGCAVAYTDKGTGNGVHDLFHHAVIRTNGLCEDATAARADSLFTASLADNERLIYNASHPFRYAFKHAHSQQNPEKDWGRFTLQAIEFALFALNDYFGSSRFTHVNTRVIASSVSNGGGAALAAAEQDTKGLIDAIVVGEPQVNLHLPEELKVLRGGKPVPAFGKPLYDYISLANLLQPVAAHAPACACSPLVYLVDRDAAQRRAQALVEANLITGRSFDQQAASALAALHEAGYEPESDLLHASHFGLEATSAIAVTYANAYTRARVNDNLCGFSFATIGNAETPYYGSSWPLLTLFGKGSGILPKDEIQLIYNDAAGGAVVHRDANGDFALLGAQRLRSLWTGSGAQAEALRAGVNEVRLTGNLHGKPAIIVHGRCDALVPVNHSSRPYFGMNQMAEGRASRLSYIEVENVQHFDTFLAPVDSRWSFHQYYLPLHYYTLQALDLMWEHLHSGAPLPPSQIIRARPRGRLAPPIDAASHLPPIAAQPAQGDAIHFDAASKTVHIPD